MHSNPHTAQTLGIDENQGGHTPGPFRLSTGDPRFKPTEPVTINGYHYVRATEQIAWNLGEPPKEDGAIVYGHSWGPYRWKAYSPKSEQARHGIKGRWQVMNDFGGWENAKAPAEWASEATIEARRNVAVPS